MTTSKAGTVHMAWKIVMIVKVTALCATDLRKICKIIYMQIITLS